MADERQTRRRRAGTGWLAWAAILALLWLGFRVLGPGGRPLAEVLGIRARSEVATPATVESGPAGEPAPDAAQRPAESPGEVFGGVVRHADGAFAEGAVVEAVFTPTDGGEAIVRRSAPTGDDGRWSLAGVPGTWSSLQVFASLGPLNRRVELDTLPGSGALEVDVNLPGAFDVGGIVIAAEDGRALTDITVRLGDREVRTDELGRFGFQALPAALLRTADTAPALVFAGAGRITTRHVLAIDAAGLDDLLIRLEPVL